MKKNDINIGNSERIASIAGGTYMLVNALSGKRNFLKALAGGFLLYRGISGHCPAYSAISRNFPAVKGYNVSIRTMVTVNRPVSEVYAYWRNLNNIPLFMKHIKEIDVINDRVSEWTAKVAGASVKWTSEIIHDIPNDHISWQSLPGSTIENAGNIHFAYAGEFTTEVHVAISYHAPAGKLGEKVAQFFNPLLEQVVTDDIHNFKHHLETGEVPTIR